MAEPRTHDAIPAAPPARRATPGVAGRCAIPLRIATALLLACVAARPAAAFRPCDGTDARVAGPRLFELEVSPISYARTAGVRSLLAPQVAVNYGTGGGFEFSLEGESVMLMGPGADDAAPRLENAAFEFKKMLRPGALQKRPGPSVAIEESVAFPSSGQSHLGLGVGVIVSQPLAFMRSVVHVNAGLGRTPGAETSSSLGAILEGPESWPVRPVGEISWEREGGDAGARALLAGVIWQTRQGLTMDAALRTVDGGQQGAELRTGFTWHMQVPKGK